MHPSMCIKTPKCHAVEVQRSKRKNSRRNRSCWLFSRRGRSPCPRRTPPSLQKRVSTMTLGPGLSWSGRHAPSSFFSSSAGASAAAAAPPAAAAPGAAAAPPEPTLTRRSLMSLPSRAYLSNHHSSATKFFRLFFDKISTSLSRFCQGLAVGWNSYLGED